MDGEGTLAGIVGRVSNSKVTISNTKFDGRFEGDNCYGNGGFISWSKVNVSFGVLGLS